jgi:hypothetical protein
MKPNIDLSNMSIEQIKDYFNKNKNNHNQVHSVFLTKVQIENLKNIGFRIYNSLFERSFTISED